MCRGPRGLTVAVAFMFLGYVLILIGSLFPFWQKGRGLDIGLLYKCQNWDCFSVNEDKVVLYVTDVVIFLSIATLTVCAVYVIKICMKICQGSFKASYLPLEVPVAIVCACFLLVLSVIIYCKLVFDDSSVFSLNFSPWLVISGAVLCGVNALCLPRTMETNPPPMSKEKCYCCGIHLLGAKVGIV